MELDLDLPPNLWKLVALAAGTSWPPQSREETEAFVRQCATEALLPILFATRSGDETLAETFRTWRAIDAANRHRTMTLRDTISRLPALIGDDFLLLKGADVAWRLYPAPELRPMGDVDVLVPPGSIDEVTRRLEDAGIRRHFGRFTHFSRHNPDRAFDLGPVTLEVHQAIVHTASARIDYDAV